MQNGVVGVHGTFFQNHDVIMHLQTRLLESHRGHIPICIAIDDYDDLEFSLSHYLRDMLIMLVFLDPSCHKGRCIGTEVATNST